MNIQQLKGIGEKTAALLSRLSVYTVKDLVGLYPRAYDVYEKPVFVQEAVEEHASEIVSIEAVVARNVEQYSTPRMKVLSTVVRDEQGTSLKCTWFNMPFLRSSLKPGARSYQTDEYGFGLHELLYSRPEYGLLPIQLPSLLVLFQSFP